MYKIWGVDSLKNILLIPLALTFTKQVGIYALSCLSLEDCILRGTKHEILLHFHVLSCLKRNKPTKSWSSNKIWNLMISILKIWDVCFLYLKVWNFETRDFRKKRKRWNSTLWNNEKKSRTPATCIENSPYIWNSQCVKMMIYHYDYCFKVFYAKTII